MIALYQQRFCFDIFHSYYLHVECIFGLFHVVLRFFSQTKLIFDSFLSGHPVFPRRTPEAHNLKP